MSRQESSGQPLLGADAREERAIVGAVPRAVRAIVFDGGRDGCCAGREACGEFATECLECARTRGNARGNAAAAGDNVDDPANGIRAVESGSRAAEHFDPLDRFEWDCEVERVVCALHIAHAHAVDEHGDLFRRAAADREIRLRRGARADINAEPSGEQFAHRACAGGGDGVACDDVDRASGVGFPDAGGDDGYGVEAGGGLGVKGALPECPDKGCDHLRRAQRAWPVARGLGV